MTVVDFAALPPEVNSGRMYTGAGSGPLMAAATAWDGLAAEVSSAANSYRALIGELTDGPWLGPASASMTAAVAPYVQWMHATGTQAEQTANQARAAAIAYEAAFTATVPPPVVAANRASLATLVATNILGQNTPAIAANEAAYAEMWAQDATAMHGYAANSAAFTTLKPFTLAPPDTNPAAPATQAASTAPSSQGASIGDVLENLILLGVNFGESPLWTKINGLTGVAGLPFILFTGPEFAALGVSILVGPLMSAALMFPPYAGVVSAHEMPAGALGSTLVSSESALGGAEMSAGLGRAALVGGLSVPQSWAAAAPEIRLAATALPTAGSAVLPQVSAAGPGGMFGGMPLVGGMANAPRNDETPSRFVPRSKVLVGRPGGPGGPCGPYGPYGHEDTPSLLASDIASALSEREREEFEELRKAVTEMAMECDAMTLLMEEAHRP